MAKILAEKNASKKDVIIAKASHLFKLKGYSSSSMRELAEAVGVVAPSLYNHIGSKSELLQLICLKVAETYTRHLDNLLLVDATILEKLENIIRFHIRIMLTHFDEVHVANHEWKHLEDPFLGFFLKQRRAYEKTLITIIEEGITNKAIKNNNPYVTVLTILSAVRGLEFWQQYKRNISIQELEDDMVNHLLKGIIK